MMLGGERVRWEFLSRTLDEGFLRESTPRSTVDGCDDALAKTMENQPKQ
jgi:hypothetical protein